MFVYKTIILAALCNTAIVLAQFEVPEALVEPLKPRGFRVSIPHVDGIQLFAFHGKLNEEFAGREGGTYSQDILRPKNGRWVFTDTMTKLKKCDKIYYWLYVDYFNGKNKLGYTRDFQEFTVSNNGQCQGAGDSSGGNDNDNDRIDVTTAKPCLSTSSEFKGSKVACRGLILEDNFNEQRTVNISNWLVEQYIPTYSSAPKYEYCSYRNRQDNVFFRDNNLHLKPLAATEDADIRGKLDLTYGCTKETKPECYHQHVSAFVLPPTSSGKIRSQSTLKYGRIEIRARLGRGDWIFSELALVSESDPSSQVIIALSRGNRQLRSKSGEELGRQVLYYGEKTWSNNSQLSSTENLEFLQNNYHLYIIDWTPNSLKITLNNEEMLNTNDHQFHNEAYLTITAGVGGVVDFPDDAMGKPWKNNERSQLLHFFGARQLWLPTWIDNDVAIKLDYVKISAI